MHCGKKRSIRLPAGACACRPVEHGFKLSSTEEKSMRSPATIALATVLCALIGVASWHAMAADRYPSRPVTVVVPFTPGGSTDILGRHEADVLQRALGQSFVVENKSGAGGEIGISYSAN